MTPDCAVPRSELTPADLTWRRVALQRPFSTIDERHLHYVSAFEAGHLGEFVTALDGLTRTISPLLTISAGAAMTTGTGLISTHTHPRAPWVSCEATIRALGESGAVGPALIHRNGDALALTFDGTHVTLRKTEGASSAEISAPVDVTLPATFTLQLTGSTLSAWVGGQLVAVLDGMEPPFIDYRDPAHWAGYHYGLRSIGAGHVVERLRGGPSGVCGAENILTVTHSDGAPYFIGNRVLMTADCSTVGRLEDWNTCLWLVDLDTGRIEVIGRLFFTQEFPGASRIEGGNFVRLQWHAARGRWLLTVLCFDGWTGLGPLPPHGVDQYAWCDLDLYGENHVADLRTLGLPTPGNAFAASAWQSGAEWLVAMPSSADAEDDSGTPADWAHLRPALWRGPSLDHLALAWRDLAIGKQMECGTRYRLNGEDYLHFSGQYPGSPIYTLAGENIGQLRDVPVGDAPGFLIDHPNESWCEWIARPRAEGTTEFFVVGNTTAPFRAEVAALVGGVPTTIEVGAVYEQARGAITIWKADQVSPGREFPVYRGERQIAPASVFVPAPFSLATGLRAHWPVVAELTDVTPFRRELLALAGGGHLTTTPVFDLAAEWTATLVAQAASTMADSSLLLLGEKVELYVHSHIVRISTFDGAAWEAIPAPFALDDALPHRYAVRHAAGVLSLWIDGVNVAEAARTFITTPGAVALGCRLEPNGYRWYEPAPVSSYHFPGTLSDVRIWQRALSDTELSAID